MTITVLASKELVSGAVVVVEVQPQHLEPQLPPQLQQPLLPPQLQQQLAPLQPLHPQLPQYQYQYTWLEAAQATRATSMQEIRKLE